MNQIHPTAVLTGDVELGSGVSVGPHAVIDGPCAIGDDVWIGPHVIIGTPAEMRHGDHPPFGHRASAPTIIIGEGTVVRELSVIQRGTNSATTLGANCFLMEGAHVSHDAKIGDDCTLAAKVALAGHITIGVGVTFGLAAAVHQWIVIGNYVMIGMNAAVTRDLPPFVTAVGVPARLAHLNSRRLTELGISAEAGDSWWRHLSTDDGASIPEDIRPHVEEFDADCAEREIARGG